MWPIEYMSLDEGIREWGTELLCHESASFACPEVCLYSITNICRLPASIVTVNELFAVHLVHCSIKSVESMLSLRPFAAHDNEDVSHELLRKKV